MPTFTAEDIKKLREVTGAGMLDCKTALRDADGDFDRAVAALREKGLAGVAKRADRAATNGCVYAYLHRTHPDLPPTLGVLVEVNCETDFVAKTEQFQALARDIAQHIAASDPRYIRVEDVPAEVVVEERRIYEAAARAEGKPDAALERIVEGRLSGFYRATVLLEQRFVKDDKVSIRDLLEAAGATLGEKVDVGRFARFRVGQQG